MDSEGIWAQILYPNVLGFGGQRAATLDPELRLLCTLIFNDAMAEIQQESGNRMYPMALMPWWDIDRRSRKPSAATRWASRESTPTPVPTITRFPTLASAIGIRCGKPVRISRCRSISTSAPAPRASTGLARRRGHHRRWTAGLLWARRCSSCITPRFSPTSSIRDYLERFPKLKFVSVESGVGWMPFLLETLDYELEEAAPQTKKILDDEALRVFPPQCLRLLLV